MKENLQFQLTKFFISSFYKKPKQQIQQVVLIIAIIYVLFQLTVINFLVYYFMDSQLLIFYNLAFSILLVYILTCYLSTTQAFAFSEFKMLASLPLSYRKISTAKVVSSLFVPIFLTMILQLPTIGFLLIDFKFIEALKLIIFLPVLIGLIAMFLLFVLSCIHRFYAKFESRVSYLLLNVVTMLLIPIIFIAYFVIESGLLNHTYKDGFINAAKYILIQLFETASLMPWIDSIVEFFVSNKVSLHLILVYVVLIITTLLLSYFTIENISVNYFKNALLENNKSQWKGSRVYISKNKWSNYLQREIWVIQSEAYFKMQVLLGVLLAPIISAILLTLLHFDALPDFLNVTKDETFDIYFSYLVLFFCCMNNVSGTPYSREGKYHYLLKCTPLDSNLVYFSKVIISSTMGIIALLLSFLLFAIFGFWEVEHLLLFMIISGLIICYNLLTPVYDMRNPLTEWENPSVAAKSNTNVLISLIYGLPILLIIAAIHFGLIWLNVQSLLATVIVLLMVVITIVLLLNRLKKVLI